MKDFMILANHTGEEILRMESFTVLGKVSLKMVLTSVLSNWKRGKELKQTRFSYYEDDQLKSRGEFKDNKPNGLYESFYINGQLMHRGKVKDGVEVGVWEYFDEEGSLIKTEKF